MAISDYGVMVIGATRIANKYRHAASAHPPLIDKPTKKWAEEQARFLAVEPYPPERPGQTYVRTYTLPTGWMVEKVKAGVYRIVNTVPYSKWVVGKKTQAWMHKGRWWTGEDKIKKNSKALTRAIAKVIKNALT